ncbi:hypothetical protein SAY86_002139 [Trapa natans]|uniref:Thioredoxin domain-containing protein n=1 Tax=Trapa natans TaxID=22666 RepID=A0AAN7R268_TRANT|nr:hypothetical protein SAY86_002139 [Trapa natans]
MALQLSQSPPSVRADSTVPHSVSAQKIGLASPLPACRFSLSKDVRVKLKCGGRSGACGVRCSLDTAVAAVGRVTEVNKDTFWPSVRAADDKTVVLDVYTQWCGPCKSMAPKFQGLSEKYQDVVFLKLDCNHENRPLAKELGIKVVPTFKILKHCQVVEEVTGAKLEDLVMAIETARLS